MKTAKNVLEVLDSVPDAAAVYCEMHMGRLLGKYYILETGGEARRLKEWLQTIAEPTDAWSVILARRELQVFVGHSDPTILSLVYEDGKWFVSPEELLKAEPCFVAMEERLKEYQKWEKWLEEYL